MPLRAAIRVLATMLAVRSAVVAQAGAAASGITVCPPPSADEVVTTLQQKNRQRAEALQQFQGIRIYRLQYRGLLSDKNAEMTVNVSYHSPDKKEFTVLSQSGSDFIINHIFKRLLQSEQEAADPENQRSTALSAGNYDFPMDGCVGTSSGPQYVLRVIPKSQSKFLYRGKIWVDSRDFAVTQIKAEPARNPSFWIKKTTSNTNTSKCNTSGYPPKIIPRAKFG